MAAARDLTPRSSLRRAGISSVVSGVIYVVMAVGGWMLFSSNVERLPTDQTLLVALMGVLGGLSALVGVGALTAASRFPMVGQMAGPNDFLFFLAVALAGLAVVAFVIMGSLGMAIFPLMALFTFFTLYSTLRKVYRSPEVRVPGEI